MIFDKPASVNHIIQPIASQQHPQMSSDEPGDESQSSMKEPTFHIQLYDSPTWLGQFSYMLIRPPRFSYNQKLLLPNKKLSKIYVMEEHLIPFKLTLYKTANMDYVLLYLHGNSSSRIQGKLHLDELPQGVGLACFDFDGCGLRTESEFITLGQKESVEVDIAARYLKGLGYCVVGWGRSMGSVSLLLSQEINIMVADSPFYSLKDLCHESSSQFLPNFCCCLFHCMYPCFFYYVQMDVKEKSGLIINEMEVAKLVAENPRNKNKKLFVMSGSRDTMVPSTHAIRIFQAFPGKKQMMLFEGTHNSDRPFSVIYAAFSFIHEQLGLKHNTYPKYKFLTTPTVKSLPKQKSVKTEETIKHCHSEFDENVTEKQPLHKECSSYQLTSAVHSSGISSTNVTPAFEHNQCDPSSDQKTKPSPSTLLDLKQSAKRLNAEISVKPIDEVKLEEQFH